MKIRIPHVAPRSLLLIAGIVWMAAGVNILRIGLADFSASWHHNYLYVLGAVVIFLIFMSMIFYRMVQKHHARIMGMKSEKVPVYHFFDKKSYLIMIFMITGGLLLRRSHLLPAIVTGFMYCGIGTSLEGAGVLFLQKYITALSPSPNKI